MQEPEPEQSNPNFVQPSTLIFEPGKVLEPLTVTEIAERWGWNVFTAHTRIRRAFDRGQLTKFQKPGHYPHYLAEQIEALFGAPPSPKPDPNKRDNSRERGPVKATNPDQIPLEFEQEAA